MLGLRRIYRFFLAVVLTMALGRNPLVAQRIEQNPLDDPKITSLRKTLGAPCSFHAQNGSLRSTIDSLRQLYPLSIWIDPGIDLDRRFDFASRGDCLSDVLNELSNHADASVAWMGTILYLVSTERRDPAESAFWRLYDEWPKSQSQVKEFSWDEASTPVEILSAWGMQNRWQFLDLESIGYDLWREGALPAGSAAAQLGCLLASIDRAAVLDPKTRSIRLVPLPAALPLRFPYPEGRIDSKIFEDWKKAWPDSRWILRDKKVWVEATPFAHRDLVAFPMRPKLSSADTKDPLANQRFSFEYEGRLLTVLNSLAAQAKLEFRPWPLERATEDARVQVRFLEADIDSILRELGKQTKAEFRRVGLNVQVIHLP